MKPGQIVKVSKRFRHYVDNLSKRYLVNFISDGMVHMTGLDDGLDYYAEPNQLIILGRSR